MTKTENDVAEFLGLAFVTMMRLAAYGLLIYWIFKHWD